MGIFNRLCVITAWAAAIGSLGVCAGWFVSRGFSDDFRAAQYFFWIPTLAYLVPAVALWIIAALAAALAGVFRLRRAATGEDGAVRPKRPARVPRLLALAAAAVITAHLAVLEYRAHNRVLALWRPGGDVRVLHWNVSVAVAPFDVLESVAAQQPDVAFIVDSTLSRIYDLPAHLPQMATVLRVGNATLISRYPLIRAGMTTLGIDPIGEGVPLTPIDSLLALAQETAEGQPGAEAQNPSRILRRIPLLRHAVPPDGFGPFEDPGRAFFFELRTQEQLGRDIVVWLIDLPSDVRLERRKVTARAREVVDAWAGPEIRATGTVIEFREPAAGTRGFPVPDVILGDFNIPRGSRSLLTLSLGYPHAHAKAGWGHAGTYPRHRPLVAIDNTFIGPSLRARRYQIVDPGRGSHRMQITDIAPAR